MEIAQCSVKGCAATASVKGMCLYHYQLNRRRKMTSVCQIDGCSNRVYSRGFCQKHYAKDYYSRKAAKGDKCKKCGEKIFCMGLCWGCYDKSRRRRLGICEKPHCYSKATDNGMCAKHSRKTLAKREKEKQS